MATPANNTDATPFQPLIPEESEADAVAGSASVQNVDSDEAADGDETAPGASAEGSPKNEATGPTGIRGAINSNRALRFGVGLRRRKAIRDLTRQRRQLQRDIITRQRMLRRLKSAVLFQEVRVAVEAATGIGLPAAAWELFRALQKNKKVKTMKKEIKNMQIAEGSTAVQIARQYNLFAREQASVNQTNPQN